MSMNKYMHPRNIYKSPPDFKKLALDFPEFRPFVKQDITGKVTVDFKDVNCLRALTCSLLKKDFSLFVEIPPSKLIPTIPLRLNYILWIEDLLNSVERFNDIIGIDIGTGASCIYPLLAAKKNKWSMIATEKDTESVTCAKSNVRNNSLQDFITIVEVKGGNLLEDVIDDKVYDFCMCNPPFFSNVEELHPFFKSRKSSRPHPKNAFCASVNEVVSKGGEVEFITKLINESKNLGERVKIYSTMIGQKCSLPTLKKALREVKVESFIETYFCQGNTTRWGLAWTFSKEFDLKKIHDPIKEQSKKTKPKHPLIHPLPLTNVNEYSITFAADKLLKMFAELEMVVEEVSRNKNILRYFVTAFSNTWANQRKKRREEMRKHKNGANELSENNNDSANSPKGRNSTNTDSNDNDVDLKKSPGKRTHECFDGSLMKKLKITTNSGEAAAVFFKFTLAVRIEETNIYLELNCAECDNREYLHQILQYIKNNLKV
ncbi:U6 small nuclear RNA (adenine-(43)-N(6))-methyltransferase [Anoplophora glabripennis]|uniref:U6 small nuclear RNA (adenine-(43)-N(6))-methyltransferase n=1 Tax=Anoplophora glabripennis TaxID=217634 RepID=UPI0008749037|nr:U6 small nuclear RNA (adenine-(43)-N(6))-methyltransferase [Anoplophora glabripennis]